MTTLLAADIGNSHTVLGLLDHGEVSADWRIKPGLSARATYQYAGQDGRPLRVLGLAQTPWISRNVFALSFTASTSRPHEQRVQPGLGPPRTASPRGSAPRGGESR